ncbi:MAG: hypothetical protein GY742_22175 [Hyphomicrobiales bacterium]|nr:hypothetical protein [Hyphomicrobiales bacterium]
MTFAIAIIPILVAAGSAVDYTRLSNEQSYLQQVLDATVLSAASENTDKNAVRIATGNAVFQADSRNPCDNIVSLNNSRSKSNGLIFL